MLLQHQHMAPTHKRTSLNQVVAVRRQHNGWLTSLANMQEPSLMTLKPQSPRLVTCSPLQQSRLNSKNTEVQEQQQIGAALQGACKASRHGSGHAEHRPPGHSAAGGLR